jgi:hypothetical protein
MRVGGTGHSDAPGADDERCELGVGGQRLIHGERIGVEVEDATDGRHERREVAEPRDADAEVQALGAVLPHLEPGRPSGHPEVSGERRRRRLFDARHGTGGHPGEDPCGIERRAVWEREVDHTRGRLGGLGALGPRARRRAATRTHLTGRQAEHLADRVVALTDARKTRRERDVGDRHVGADEEHARGVRAMRPGEGQGAGPEFRGEQARQMPAGVSEPRGEPRHALAFDDPRGDQPHRPGGRVSAEIPGGRAGRGLRKAALAGAESGLVRGSAGREECDVLGLRRTRRAARAAVDPGRPDGRHELPVEAGVAGTDRAIPLVEVGRAAIGCSYGVHASTLPLRTRACWRKSDIAVAGQGRFVPTGFPRRVRLLTVPTERARSRGGVRVSAQSAYETEMLGGYGRVPRAASS